MVVLPPVFASASPLSIGLSLAAATAYAAPALVPQALGTRLAQWSLSLAWLLHAVLWASSLVGEQPRFGFGPALSVMAWLVLTVYAVERQLFPQLRSRLALAGLGSVAVLLALIFPGTPLHAGASAWLPLHLVLGIASYAMFAAAVVHGWLMDRTEHHIRQATEPAGGLPLLTLERLTFRFVQAGFVLLSATLAAGWLFGGQLYGHQSGSAWRWDHKTVFSVLSWLCFALLLLGRYRLGWRGRLAVRMLYAGSGLLLMAYAGSRFVLEVVLGRLS